MATEARGTGPGSDAGAGSGEGQTRRRPDPAAIARIGVRALGNVGRALRDGVLALVAARVPREWVVVRLDHGVVETDPVPAWIPRPARAPVRLADVVECFALASRDPKVRGVVVRVGRVGLGWGKVAAIARGLAACREAGKRTVVYAEGAGNAGAWLGATAEAFWIAPLGRIDLVGFQIESPFVRGLLDHLQIRPMVVQGGRYKSAAELLERTNMSPESREALDAVADTLFGALVEGLARRAGSPDRARAWIDGGPHLAADALACGLVDRLLYPDELREALAAMGTEPGSARGSAERASPARPAPSDPRVGEADEGVQWIGHERYVRLARPRFRFRPLSARADGRDRQIAVVPLAGTITEASVRPVVELLQALRKEPELGAVVLRIDSPGGDAEASDAVWRAVKRLREKVPVVASMGDTAASGGYYAAMAANEIVAEETTLTGSIGVVLAGIEIDALMERVGVRFDGVRRGERAGIYSATHARTTDEREALSRQVSSLYRSFVGKAAADRGKTFEELDALAEGRVWSGRDALAGGLVDHLGGMDAALSRARDLGGLDPEGSVPVYLAAQAPGWRRFIPGRAAATGPDDPDLPLGALLLCPIRPPQS